VKKQIDGRALRAAQPERLCTGGTFAGTEHNGAQRAKRLLRNVASGLLLEGGAR